MKFYAVRVYTENNRDRLGNSTEVYFTSIEEAEQAYKELCKKYNAHSLPVLTWTHYIDHKCSNVTNQDVAYASVSLVERGRPYYHLNGNMVKEIRKSRSFK